MNKKTLILTFFSVLLIFSATGQGESSELLKMMEESDTSKDVNIDLINQTPSKNQPGEYVNLKFNISFKGFSPSNTSDIRISESLPLNYNDSLSSKKKIKDLKKINENEESYLVDYRLNVSDKINKNERSIYVRYLSESNNRNFSENFNISVKKVGTEFDIYIGKISDTRIIGNVENVGNTTAKSIRVFLLDQPGIVREEVKTKVLGVLKPDEEKIVDFEGSNMSVGENYQFKVRYKDSQGRIKKYVESIEMNELHEVPVKAKLTKTNSSGAFYKVKNTGPEQISSVAISFETSEVNLSGKKTQTIGDISSKDSKFATYKITDSEVSKTEIRIFYTDITGMIITTTQAVRVPNSSEIKKISTNPENNVIRESSTTLILMSLGGLLIIIAFINRRRKHKKKEESFQEFETNFEI